MKRILTAILAVLYGITAINAQQWPEASRETSVGSRWWWLGSALDKENVK